jgi:hypothetical protein
MIDIVENINKDILVIVIGSTSAYKSNPSDFYWAKYYIEKSAIIKAGRDFNTMGYNISIVSPGTVDTYRNVNKNVPKLSPNDIGKSIKQIIEVYKNDGVLIEHLVIRPRK